jgi:hypothetical protein
VRVVIIARSPSSKLAYSRVDLRPGTANRSVRRRLIEDDGEADDLAVSDAEVDRQDQLFG